MHRHTCALVAALATVALCSVSVSAASAGTGVAAKQTSELRAASSLKAIAVRPTGRFDVRDDVVPFPTAEEIAKDAPMPPSGFIDPSRDSSGAVAIVPLDDTAGGPEYEIFQSAGVPSVIVKSLQDAFSYRLVILAGTLTSTSLSDDDFKRLNEFVASGGNVIVEAATAHQVQDMVGWTDAIESNTRQSLKFCDGCGVAEQIDTNGERYVALDTFADDSPMGTVGYKVKDDGDSMVVPATFDDGTAAVVLHAYGTGHVLAIGARLLDLVTRHWEGTRFSPRRTYANVAGSDADVWLLGLRSLYRQITPGALTLSTSPDGTRAALIPTISANWSTGVVTAARYVAALAKVGAKSTVFIPTHYTEDWLDSAFFPFPGTDPNADQVATTRSIISMEANGAEIGSHSVAHSPVFNKLPMGKGDETVASYKPFVKSKTETDDATVTGELRVSRQLLTQFAPRKLSDADALATVTSFRAGYLLSPRGLAEALDATGYRYDSTSTQGFVEGAMPFHMPRLDDKGFSNVFEFPITIEDEAKPAFASRIDSAASVIAQNAANGVPSVVLVHPNADKEKIAAYQKLIQLSQKVTADQVPPVGDADADPLWTGTLRDFGAFWSERDGLALATYSDAASCAGGTVFVVYNRGTSDAEGQAIDVGDDQLVTGQVNGETIAVNAYRKLPLPTIAAGDAIKGELCPVATGPNLESDWKLIGRTPDGTWAGSWAASSVHSADGNPSDYDFTTDLGAGPITFTATVKSGGLCLGGAINTGVIGTVTGGCGAISDDTNQVGPIPIYVNGTQIGTAELAR
jgi:peptidoglycan/xylan/chitin deacetylase (PgdA/CDA1 family)